MDTAAAIADGAQPCIEDQLLVRAHNEWVCGPARDDAAWTMQTEDCDGLVGSGDFEDGYWGTYTCISWTNDVLPDTGMAPSDGGLTIGIGAILVGTWILARARRRPR